MVLQSKHYLLDYKLILFSMDKWTVFSVYLKLPKSRSILKITHANAYAILISKTDQGVEVSNYLLKQ